MITFNAEGFSASDLLRLHEELVRPESLEVGEADSDELEAGGSSASDLLRLVEDLVRPKSVEVGEADDNELKAEISAISSRVAAVCSLAEFIGFHFFTLNVLP